MPEHSPLPWTPRRSEIFGSTDIRDVFDAESREVRVMGFGLTGGAQAAANADLIVRAVNAHAGLLESLKWALAQVGRPTRRIPGQNGSYCDAYERAEAAIAKAEGR